MHIEIAVPLWKESEGQGVTHIHGPIWYPLFSNPDWQIVEGCRSPSCYLCTLSKRPRCSGCHVSSITVEEPPCLKTKPDRDWSSPSPMLICSLPSIDWQGTSVPSDCSLSLPCCKTGVPWARVTCKLLGSMVMELEGSFLLWIMYLGFSPTLFLAGRCSKGFNHCCSTMWLWWDLSAHPVRQSAGVWTQWVQQTGAESVHVWNHQPWSEWPLRL